jgi:hypothetical protein
MAFVGRSHALTSQGIAAAAESIAVGVEEVWTVVSVETSGCGFIADRRPKILYERHIFHRLTDGRFDDGNISDASPGGYGPSGAHQYERLTIAMNLDREAALRSASWGLGQVLGENFSAAGFDDVDAMVQAMSDSEDAQLLAVSEFVLAHGLDRPLRAHNWASFARGYNGPNFAEQHYDARLRGEFQKFSTGVMPSLDVRAAQLYLTFRGLDPGPIDGLMGRLTRSAVVEFQIQSGLAPTGVVDETLLARLIVPENESPPATIIG